MANMAECFGRKEGFKVKRVVVFLLLAACLAFSSCNISSGTDGDPKAYTVNFEANGGTAVSPQEISTLTEAPLTAREGYAFCGWYRDEALTQAVSYPMSVEKTMTLYAKWTKDTESSSCADAAVQFSLDDEYSYKAEYILTPQELDLSALAALGYYVKIDVTYEVYYVKDFDFPLGYMGAPDHSVAILDLYDEGEIREDIPTEKQPEDGSISKVVRASDLLNGVWRLKLSTLNLQNTVHFQDIQVKYSCQTQP